jgi:hypothetical protein
MKITEYPNRIPEIYGTFIFLGLTLYFLVSYWVGVVHVIELRLLNLFILATGVYLALKQYQRTHRGQVNYFRAFAIGVASSTIGTSTFVLMLFILFNLDKPLFESVVKGEPMGRLLNVWVSTFAVWYEGIFSGIFTSFVLVNTIDTSESSETP